MKKIFIAGLVYTIIATAIRYVERKINHGYYIDPQYYDLWSRITLPSFGRSVLVFFIITMTLSFLIGITVAAIYNSIKYDLHGSFLKRTLIFTLVITWLSLVLFILPTGVTFNISLFLLVSWLISSMLIVFLSATAFSRILK